MWVWQEEFCAVVGTGDCSWSHLSSVKGAERNRLVALLWSGCQTSCDCAANAGGRTTHQMWRIEEAAVLCVSYLRGSRWWDVLVILSPWQHVGRQGVDWKLGRCNWRMLEFERKIGSINEPTSAHSRVNSIHRCPGAHHTIKKPNYQIPPEGAWCHNVRGKSSKCSRNLDQAPHSERKAICFVWMKELTVVFLSTWPRLATCLGCYFLLPSERGQASQAWCLLQQRTLGQKMHRCLDWMYEHDSDDLWGEIFSVQRWEHRFLYSYQHILLFGSSDHI